MHGIELVIFLLAVVAVAAWLARYVSSVPYPIVLLAAGLMIGLVPGLGPVEIDPELILLVFLPPLVHAAAWQSSPRRLKAAARTVGLLAVVLVGATMACVAVVAHAVVPGLEWGPAFVLGAIVSPTDVVAATSIFRRLGVPERIVALIEGESLLNDGSALVLYRVAVAAVALGTFSVGGAAVDLLVVGAGGALFGLLVAWVIAQVRRRVEDDALEITFTLLTPYLAFLPAEELGLSGVLAAVSSGLYLGWRAATDVSAGTRLQAMGFWNVLVFIFESVLFILIGLQIPRVIEALAGESLARLALAALLVSLTVIVVRLAFQFTVGELESAWDVRRGRTHLGRRERTVIGWSGMRGAVSLAAALAVPLETAGGVAFPQRDLILFLTLAVIAVTLVVQGLTLPVLVNRLGVEATGSSVRQRATARFRTVEAALERISELSFDGEVPPQALERARAMYATRAQQLTGACRTGLPEGTGDDGGAFAGLRRHLLEVERSTLIELRDEGRVPAAAIREVERDLDLEEERLSRAAPLAREPVGPAAAAVSGGE